MVDGCVGGMLISSLLSVSCVTVAFCSNMLMVQDKVNGSRGDLTVAPVKSSTLSLAYYAASLFSTLLICFVALGAGLCYIASLGWYLSLADILFMVADVLFLVLFGTAVSIAERIEKEGKVAVDDYFKFLSSGGSDSPVALLKLAGVDLTKMDAFDSCMESFDKALSEFEAIED